MTEKRVRVKAKLSIETNVDLILYDDQTPRQVLEQCLYEGLKQYMKDYDYSMGYEQPVNVDAILLVENLDVGLVSNEDS